MIAQSSVFTEHLVPAETLRVATPSALVECGLFIFMAYTMLGGAYGLFVNNLASSVLVLSFLLCIYEVGVQALRVTRIIAYPLACGVSYTFIQLVFFDESLTDAIVPILFWMMLIFLVQMLALREKFLHRFALSMFLIGLAALPYLSFYDAAYATGKMQRAGMSRSIGFGSTNAMGEWYGFCSVYFIVLGIVSAKHSLRALSWIVGTGCFYVMTLSVSRGALLAVAIAVLMASRRMLKDGFIPLLILALGGWIVVELGIFDKTAQFYATRGTEETGRLAIWPLIIESFLNSPLTGVGHAHVGGITARGSFVTPHNGFLYVAQASGIVPLVFFMAYWFSSGRAALRAYRETGPDSTFILPFWTFAFLTVNAGNLTFMQFSVIASLAFPLAAGLYPKASDISA